MIFSFSTAYASDYEAAADVCMTQFTFQALVPAQDL